MLYSIGASGSTGMSEPGQAVAKALHRDPAAAFNPMGTGLYTVKGPSFQDRLIAWGPAVGPAMKPANDFSKAYIPNTGLAGPLTWLEGKLGIESAADMVQDASDILSGISDDVSPLSSELQNDIAQINGYSSAQDASIQAKAQACQAEAAGLLATLSNVQSAYGALSTQVSLAAQDPSVNKDSAQALKTRASNLETQVQALLKNVDQLESHINDLEKAAQSGPSISQALENTAAKSINTLTWLVGGGALVYLLAPTFVPRMIGGLRKAARS